MTLLISLVARSEPLGLTRNFPLLHQIPPPPNSPQPTSHPHYSPQHAEIKARLSKENQELSTVLSLKAWSGPECRLACFAYCQEFTNSVQVQTWKIPQQARQVTLPKEVTGNTVMALRHSTRTTFSFLYVADVELSTMHTPMEWFQKSC